MKESAGIGFNPDCPDELEKYFHKEFNLLEFKGLSQAI